ncbi:PstS family phosphate ABC transporter substrate-binding protein [Pontibacter akesuensis]|uniref:Phosphate ABC transporter substrate-binding protein, PhoT family n=1 Tax=Pontibacter akesuensis TaxID=388950 RepID=A0A1I7IJ02_9BACT|nr:substrate-binding domain-containing protein [Pontibacter akesuensis]GHA67427.1 phosphate ABC transporter substrate-binding protein [Pontibacter akesuensis]SFU72892.1 phosphate ABC transporter substrate-binding protein, PhoT family [Pontibacter akesuensis]
MKSKLLPLAALAVMLSLVSCGGNTGGPTDTPTSGNINISVDESFRPIIESEVNTFEGIYTNANIDAAYKSEGEVVKDLLNDSTKIAILSRELTPEEIAVFEKNKRFPRTTKIAIDAVALITNRQNPDSLLTMEELKRIFNGEAKTWSAIDESSNLGDITIVFDNNNSGTARYVRDSLITGNKLPENTFASNSHEALIDYVAENKNALGVIGVNWISDFDDSTAIGFLNRIKVLGISEDPNPVTTGSYFQPYQGYIAQKSYPLRRYLYIVSTEARSGLGTGFASYVAGDKGQRLILKSGLVPATMPVRVIGLGNQ